MIFLFLGTLPLCLFVVQKPLPWRQEDGSSVHILIALLFLGFSTSFLLIFHNSIILFGDNVHESSKAKRLVLICAVVAGAVAPGAVIVSNKAATISRSDTFLQICRVLVSITILGVYVPYYVLNAWRRIATTHNVTQKEGCAKLVIHISCVVVPVSFFWTKSADEGSWALSFASAAFQLMCIVSAVRAFPGKIAILSFTFFITLPSSWLLGASSTTRYFFSVDTWLWKSFRKWNVQWLRAPLWCNLMDSRSKRDGKKKLARKAFPFTFVYATFICVPLSAAPLLLLPVMFPMLIYCALLLHPFHLRFSTFCGIECIRQYFPGNILEKWQPIFLHQY